jgi:hypothetical protein
MDGCYDKKWGVLGPIPGQQKTKRIPFFKNEPEKLLKTKGKATFVAKSEPENEAEKLLKTRSRGNNEPETNRKRSYLSH